MEDCMVDEDYLNSFYCPSCGRSFADHLEGELRKPCERCKTRLRVIVHGAEFSIVGIKSKKSRHIR